VNNRRPNEYIAVKSDVCPGQRTKITPRLIVARPY
jgi:hypothetical protein